MWASTVDHPLFAVSLTVAPSGLRKVGDHARRTRAVDVSWRVGNGELRGLTCRLDQLDGIVPDLPAHVVAGLVGPL